MQVHFDCYLGKVDVVSSRYSALLGKNEIIPEVRSALVARPALFTLFPTNRCVETTRCLAHAVPCHCHACGCSSHSGSSAAISNMWWPSRLGNPFDRSSSPCLSVFFLSVFCASLGRGKNLPSSGLAVRLRARVRVLAVPDSLWQIRKQQT